MNITEPILKMIKKPFKKYIKLGRTKRNVMC